MALDSYRPFGRLITAVATPLDGARKLDTECAQRLARHVVEMGTDTVFVSGSTGESPTLTDSEKLALSRAVIETVGQDAQVIVGTGSNDTAHSVDLSKAAAELGAHGFVAVTPYYNRPTQLGLEAHFTAIPPGSGHDRLLLRRRVRRGNRPIPRLARTLRNALSRAQPGARQGRAAPRRNRRRRTTPPACLSPGSHHHCPSRRPRQRQVAGGPVAPNRHTERRARGRSKPHRSALPRTRWCRAGTSVQLCVTEWCTAP
jgi:hypothetical protein